MIIAADLVLFNSAQFVFVFFPIVTCLYYVIPARLRWGLLLIASCYFYAVAVPAYLLVLAAIIVVDYAAGIAIEGASGRRRRLFLTISICANVGLLAVFKYFDFVEGSAASLARTIGWNYSVRTLGLVLPIGLSFHTFQSMAYTIEVYNGRAPAERHAGLFALYVLFYPQLVAGPIERPEHLLPQLREQMLSDDAARWSLRAVMTPRFVDGLRLVLVGLFKKLVIADRLALVVDPVYGDPGLYRGGLALLVATVFFAVQIYCDFSAYTDIARGAAAVMAIDLRENFNRPYGAESIREFWHRWHMSLSTWFRDYVYVPLGGGRWRWVRNVSITFVLSGLWHGANWTFVLWGALHASYFLISRATRDARAAIARATGLARLPSAHRVVRVAFTFALTCGGWILFRARTVGDAWYIATHLVSGIGDVFAPNGGGAIARLGLASLTVPKHEWALSVALAVGVLVADQRGEPASTAAGVPSTWLRWPVYYALALSVMFLGVYKTATFIYFQF